MTFTPLILSFFEDYIGISFFLLADDDIATSLLTIGYDYEEERFQFEMFFYNVFKVWK